MEIYIFKNKNELGIAASSQAVTIIKRTIVNKKKVNIILATGTSQFETLKNLVQNHKVDWSRVTMFHLDEYIGISDDHPASFRKYLKERFVNKVPSLKAYYFINGNTEQPDQECQRLNEIINKHPIDIALIGIGENGHIAFNDPPADFKIEDPYIVVDLDNHCRQQQVNEGWFPSLNHVPTQAISMSIKYIMKTSHIIVSVPDERKAVAVKNAIEGKVTNTCPASILQEHPDCRIFLDKPAASLLSEGKGGHH